METPISNYICTMWYDGPHFWAYIDDVGDYWYVSENSFRPGDLPAVQISEELGKELFRLGEECDWPSWPELCKSSTRFAVFKWVGDGEIEILKFQQEISKEEFLKFA